MSLTGGTKRSQSNAADAKMYELVKFPWTFINDVTNMTPIPMVRNASNLLALGGGRSLGRALSSGGDSLDGLGGSGRLLLLLLLAAIGGILVGGEGDLGGLLDDGSLVLLGRGLLLLGGGLLGDDLLGLLGGLALAGGGVLLRGLGLHNL